jgi:hypothetical protein
VGPHDSHFATRIATLSHDKVPVIDKIIWSDAAIVPLAHSSPIFKKMQYIARLLFVPSAVFLNAAIVHRRLWQIEGGSITIFCSCKGLEP